MLCHLNYSKGFSRRLEVVDESPLLRGESHDPCRFASVALKINPANPGTLSRSSCDPLSSHVPAAFDERIAPRQAHKTAVRHSSESISIFNPQNRASTFHSSLHPDFTKW